MRSRNDPVIVHPFRVRSGSIDDWIECIKDAILEDQTIVIASTRSVHGPEHLAFAIHHAFRAISRGNNRARDASIEVLRWLAGSRQVSKAIEATSPPGPGGDLIIALIGPDIDVPPRIELKIWDGGPIEGLDPIDPEDHPIWGGDSVKELYGIEVSGDELRMAILEMVAMCDL